MNSEKFTLDNGITVLLDQINQIESVSVRVLFKAGSRDETGYINGISHCLEHMNFKGTSRRNAAEIAEEFDMIGGYLNAYTSRDSTVYAAKVLKEDIGLAIDMLADLTNHSVYDEEELQKEINVIIHEIVEGNDDPSDLVFDLMQEAAYQNQVFGLPIAGRVDLIKQITRQNLIDYAAKYYIPSNTIIGIAGNIEINQIKEQLNQRFVVNSKNSHNSSNFCQKSPFDSGITQPKAVYIGGDRRSKKDVEQIHVALCFNGSSYFDDNYYAQQILAIIAGGGMSSRLFQEVREKRGLAYGISSFCSNYHDTGIFGIFASSSTDKINELIKVCGEQIRGISENVTESELNRAKAQIRSGILMSQESSSKRAEKMVNNYAVFDRVITFDEILQKIDELEPKDIAKEAKSLLQNLTNQQLTVAMAGNITDVIYDYDKITSLFRI